MKLDYPIYATLKRLTDRAKRDAPRIFGLLALYTFAAAAASFPAVLLPKLVIEELTGPGRVERILVIALCFSAISAALSYMKNLPLEAARIRNTLLRIDYVRDQFDKILRLDYPYCEDDAFMDKYEKAFQSTSGNSNGVEAVYNGLFQAPALVLTVAVLSLFIGLREPFILLAIFINIAAVIFISRQVHAFRFSKKAELGHAQRRRNYFFNVSEDFSYGKDIRVYSLRERVINALRREITGYADVYRLIASREYALGFIGLATLALSDAATYGLLAYSVTKGMSIADFSMYIAAALSLSSALKMLSEKITLVLNEGEYVHELFTFLDDPMTTSGGTHAPVSGDETLEIEFRDVSFKYPNSEKYIYEHLDLKIAKGERLALVGVNGAGKSTLVKLITGLFPASEGEILINGIPIGEFSKKALYSMFSAVFQEVNVLAYTVLENVACCDDGDRARAEDALRRAGLWDKIASLPKGLDTVMLKIIDENGAIFSGGEAQKLSIARALYKDANMVIMDEPTAALDALAEQDIYERFGELTHGRTALYISHRLASTRFCDRIILLDGAHIAEEGTHEELMEKRGKYYDMFTIQGKYYTSDAAAGGDEA